MWQKRAKIPDDAWGEAIDMDGTQVAELSFTPKDWQHERLRLIVRRVPVTAEELRHGNPKARRRKTIPPEQLQMVLDGQLDSTYAYSLIVTDIPIDEKTTAEVELFHRQRAQIEERFKDAKLGQALRHLPSRDLRTVCAVSSRSLPSGYPKHGSPHRVRRRASCGYESAGNPRDRTIRRWAGDVVTRTAFARPFERLLQRSGALERTGRNRKR
jgi:hypothetical protein